MIWTALGIIGGLILTMPALGILRALRDAVSGDSSARDGASILHPLICLLLLGGIAFAAFTQHIVLGIAALAAFTVLDGFTYWGSKPTDKPKQGEETVRRGTRVVDATHRTRKAVDDRSIQMGGVEIPKNLEAQHILIAGTTGAGKTQIINGMLRTIRKRGQRAVIADPAGGFYARLGQSGDKLLNPFDQRSVAWSPFAEIRADYDCERIAKAIIPDLDGGDGAQWQLFAQVLLAKTLLSMHRKRERSIKRLIYWMGAATQEELEPLLAGSPAAVLCQQGNEKMLNNMRATMMPYLSAFDYLEDEGTFSIRHWIHEDWKEHWLFLTYRDDQMGMLRIS